MREYDMNYCRVISEDEIDEALTELYIKQGRYNVMDNEVYDRLTGKYIGRYDKTIEEFRK